MLLIHHHALTPGTQATLVNEHRERIKASLTRTPTPKASAKMERYLNPAVKQA